jgi:hypothetical protein
MTDMDGMLIAQRLIAEEREKKTGFLDLGNLKLTEVPVELFELTHLRGLNLGSWYINEHGGYRQSSNVGGGNTNKLCAVPSAIGALSNLLTLSINDTQVSDLSPLIDIMRLEKLTVNDCRLDDFPRQLLFSHSLRELILHHASIPGIPAEVLSNSFNSNCLEDFCAHLVDAESGSEEVREAKLVVLGNGRVGKTQICRQLRRLPYDETVPSTHGIIVTAEPWVGSSSGDVLNIWDFGGQDIYHGTHTLFMKTSAVFVIVWHPEFETADDQSADGILFRNYPLPYWLAYVRTLGRKDCPVLVVHTRCDRPEQEVLRLPARMMPLSRSPRSSPAGTARSTNGGMKHWKTRCGMPFNICATGTGSPRSGSDGRRSSGNLRPGETKTRLAQQESDGIGPYPRRNSTLSASTPEGYGRQTVCSRICITSAWCLPASSVRQSDHPGPIVGAGCGLRSLRPPESLSPSFRENEGSSLVNSSP